jgi:hypothetical protein
MEAEAREILARGVFEERSIGAAPANPPIQGKFTQLAGIWKGRMTTDEVMQITRGE